MQTISANSVVVAATDLLSTHLEDEAVILHLKEGVYFGLDQVGAKIWNLLAAPRTVTEILETLLEEYEVEPHRCEQDLLKLLSELQAKGLIEIRDGKSA